MMSWVRAGARFARLERIHQFTGHDHRIAHRGQDARRSLQRVLDDLVEQVLDGPGEFADVGGAHHAARALERMERATHARQRFGLERVLFPGREQLGDPRHFFARLFYIKSEQFGVDVDRLGADRRLRRLVQRRGALHAGRRDAGLQRVRAGGGAGVGQQHGGGIGLRAQRRHGGHHALGHLRQRLQAGLRVVEHVPGIRASGLQRLHVVLEAHHRVRQPVEVVRRDGGAARLQQVLEMLRDAVDDLDGARLAEHQQSGLDALDQARPRIERR